MKIDVRKDDLVDVPGQRWIARSYSDYPDFRVTVDSLEEICASKARALIERKKRRDYFDLCKLLSLRMNRTKLARILPAKLAVKGLDVPEVCDLSAGLNGVRGEE